MDIWPDNDEAGFKAADQLCSILRQTGIKSFNVIDTKQLTENFPEKWDLADQLPQGKTTIYLQNIILTSRKKSMGIDRFDFLFKEKQELTVEKLQVYEILWRVEERLWPKLEEKYGCRVWDIEKEILKETQHLLLQGENLDKSCKLITT